MARQVSDARLETRHATLKLSTAKLRIGQY